VGNLDLVLVLCGLYDMVYQSILPTDVLYVSSSQ